MAITPKRARKQRLAPIERLSVPDGFRFRPPATAFGCPVTGECMEPYIFAGDVTVIDPARTPEDGQCVVVEHLERGMLVKQYRVESGGAALVATNDPGIHIPVNAQVNIIGVVTLLRIPLPDPHAETRRRRWEEAGARNLHPPDTTAATAPPTTVTTPGGSL